MSQTIDFYIAGLEAAIQSQLKNGESSGEVLVRPGLGTATNVMAYGGELDDENFTRALKVLAPRFPLALVTYGSGQSKRKAATAILEGDPIEMEHQCGFMVVLCSDNRRGKDERRADVYQLIGATVDLLGGVIFAKLINEGEENEESITLNAQPFIVDAIECITRLPDLTAYAVHFNTSFHHWLPDRRTVAAGNADEIEVNIDPTNPPASPIENNLPGVHAS